MRLLLLEEDIELNNESFADGSFIYESLSAFTLNINLHLKGLPANLPDKAFLNLFIFVD